MNIGITLMIVGMVTVFAVLIIIIQLSKLLIKIVNRFAPEEDVKPKTKAETAAAAISQDVMAVIQATVAQITGGKGVATDVKRI